jgi:hypothetical protein
MSKKPKHYWNYRIMKLPIKGWGEIPLYQIHEVHYENEKPTGYTIDPIAFSADSVKSLKWMIKKMKKAFKKPILKKKDFDKKIKRSKLK